MKPPRGINSTPLFSVGVILDWSLVQKEDNRVAEFLAHYRRLPLNHVSSPQANLPAVIRVVEKCILKGSVEAFECGTGKGLVRQQVQKLDVLLVSSQFQVLVNVGCGQGTLALVDC